MGEPHGGEIVLTLLCTLQILSFGDRIVQKIVRVLGGRVTKGMFFFDGGTSAIDLQLITLNIQCVLLCVFKALTSNVIIWLDVCTVICHFTTRF